MSVREKIRENELERLPVEGYAVYAKTPPPREWSRISVFDIDGVIADVTQRLLASLRAVGADPKEALKYGSIYIDDRVKRRMFWKTFMSPEFMHLDRPREEGLKLLRRAVERGNYIVLLSGRKEDMVSDTISQMNEWGVEWDMLVLRVEGDYRKDRWFKYEFIRDHLGGKIYELHDDMIAVCVTISEGSKKVSEKKVFEPSKTGYGGLIYNRNVFVTEVASFKIYHHVGDSWYSFPTHALVLEEKGKRRLVNIDEALWQHPVDKVAEVTIPVSFPVKVKWMWYRANAKNEEELVRILRGIQETIDLIRELGGTPGEYVPDEFREILSEEDLVAFADEDGEEWRIPRLFPAPLLYAFTRLRLKE